MRTAMIMQMEKRHSWQQAVASLHGVEWICGAFVCRAHTAQLLFLQALRQESPATLGKGGCIITVAIERELHCMGFLVVGTAII